MLDCRCQRWFLVQVFLSGKKVWVNLWVFLTYMTWQYLF